MKRLLVLLTLFGVTLSGGVQAEESIRVGGTGIGTLLLQRMIDSYSKVRLDVNAKTMVPPLGSNGGLRALASGAIDIAVATIPSSFPTASENEATNKIIPWVRTPFIFTGRDVVSGTRLTLGQVAEIYSGRFAQWADGKPVRLITRTERESDTRLLRAISREMNEAMTMASKRTGMPFAENDIDNQQLLERVPGSFGAIGLGQVLLSDSPLKPISLDGVLPSVENLISGVYRMEKPLYLIVSKSPSPATLEFIQYLHSPDVLAAIRRYGFIPMPR